VLAAVYTLGTGKVTQVEPGWTSALPSRSNAGFAADNRSIRMHFPLRAFRHGSFYRRFHTLEETR